MIFSSFAFAEGFLGFFTTDRYPVDNCKVVATESMQVFNTKGTYRQYIDQNKHSYLDEIGDIKHRKIMQEEAIKKGFNAIVGYSFDVYGGFVGNGDGKVVNGTLGYGVYITQAMGVPVKVVCN